MQISSYFCDGNLAILADVVLAQDIGSLHGRGSDLISHGRSDYNLTVFCIFQVIDYFSVKPIQGTVFIPIWKSQLCCRLPVTLLKY